MKNVEIIDRLPEYRAEAARNTFIAEEEARKLEATLTRIRAAKKAAKARREKEARKPLTASLAALAAFKA